MWFLAVMLWLAVLLVPLGAALWIFRQLDRQRQRLAELEARLASLESGAAGRAPVAEAESPAPASFARAATPPPVRVAPSAPAPAPAPPPPLPRPSPPPSPAGAFGGSKLEELIGGVWLQNAGSVLLLLGVLSLILWGYTTGRIGPAVLVMAGVALGCGFVWRGDRTARGLPAFGYALIGIGVGIAYLSLYLGHFSLGVLSRWAALGLLAAVSVGSIGLGLRYRVQSIAALGVIGAFLPELVGQWPGLHGFGMTPAALLGYLAVVNLAVFALTARAGWSLLALAAVILTALAWLSALPGATSGWSVEIGLSLLFVLLGLARLPRLVGRAEAVRPADLALVAAAPLCLILASWPFLAATDRLQVGAHFSTLAAAYALAAGWVNRRREDQDLWRPLTGAAILFLTAGLQRAVGDDGTAMAWSVEGLVLTAIGLRPRGGWLRACGYAVTALGALAMLHDLVVSGWVAERAILFSPVPLRSLVCLAALLAGSAVLARRRAYLLQGERWMPEAWAAAGNFGLALWSAREVNPLGNAVRELTGIAALYADSAAARMASTSLATTLACAAWLAQAAVLYWRGRAPGRGFLRACAYPLAAMAWFTLCVVVGGMDAWRREQWPVLHPVGLVSLAAIAAYFTLASSLAADRPRLRREEGRMSEIWTAAAHVLLLIWINREAAHLALASGEVARWLEGLPLVAGGSTAELETTLAAAYSSLGWTLQAAALLALGWSRPSPYLRWLSLGIFCLTAFKFVLVDLHTVDVFWRFLVAVVVGAVLLTVSYAYQRRRRAAAATAPTPDEPGSGTG